MELHPIILAEIILRIHIYHVPIFCNGCQEVMAMYIIFQLPSWFFIFFSAGGLNEP